MFCLLIKPREKSVWDIFEGWKNCIARIKKLAFFHFASRETKSLKSSLIKILHISSLNPV